MSLNSLFTIYWPFLAFVIMGIIAMIGTWNNVNNKVTSLKSDGADRDKDMAELKGRINTMQPDLGTIKTDIAVIKNTLEYIKGSVSKTNVMD